MSDPKGSPHTWTQFLSDLWKTLPVGSIELTLPDERAFRNAFVKVCADAGEIGTNRDRLLNRFLRRHDPILNFVHRLDEVLKLDDTLCLKLLFYTVALATARVSGLRCLVLDDCYSPHMCSIGRFQTQAKRTPL